MADNDDLIDRLTEIGSTLADIAESLDRDGMSEVGAALADLVEVLSAQKPAAPDMVPLAEAIRAGQQESAQTSAQLVFALREQIQVLASRPAKAGQPFSLSFVPEYDGSGRISRVTVSGQPT